MFCTQCGKQIAGDSSFCEHCGTKLPKTVGANNVEREKEESINVEGDSIVVPKEIKNRDLKSMADHLEFLGYKIEKLDIEGEREWVAARHATNNNYIFRELSPSLTLFQAGLKSEKKYEAKMAESVNELNKVLNITKVYCEFEDGLALLRIEAVYTGEYVKEEFARFQEQFERDQSLMSQLDCFKVFLK